MSGNSGDDANLRNTLLKSRIAKLPHLPAISPSQWRGTSSSAGEEQDEQRDGLTSLAMAPPLRSAIQRSTEHTSSGSSFGPLTAEDCFSQALEVEIGDDSGATYRVYYTPPNQSLIREQRRGEKGLNRGVQANDLYALQPTEVDDGEDEIDRPYTGSSSSAGTLFFLHHGAGYSALSYALVAKQITKLTDGQVGVLAFDCRGHGKTQHSSIIESESLSLTNLTQDCIAILAKMFPPSKPQPTLVLVGHSMGGSVVVSLCHALSDGDRMKSKSRPRVAGVAVLDVVEGTAIAALPSMRTIVSALPKGFHSIEEAIQWHVDSGTIVNVNSARRSVPSLLVRTTTSEIATQTPRDAAATSSLEEGEPIEVLSTTDGEAEKPGQRFGYHWRHDLLATEPYWADWFEGLSQSFLSVKCARLLLLAGTDRLDKELMIGQMQGKYQLVVFADVGHSLQEDAPDRTAQVLVDFWQRNESLDVSSIRATSLRKVGEP